jgi:hypothetical protein
VTIWHTYEYFVYDYRKLWRKYRSLFVTMGYIICLFHGSGWFRPVIDIGKGVEYFNWVGLLYGSFTIGAGGAGMTEQERGGVCWERIGRVHNPCRSSFFKIKWGRTIPKSI